MKTIYVHALDAKQLDEFVGQLKEKGLKVFDNDKDGIGDTFICRTKADFVEAVIVHGKIINGFDIIVGMELIDYDVVDVLKRYFDVTFLKTVRKSIA